MNQSAFLVGLGLLLIIAGGVTIGEQMLVVALAERFDDPDTTGFLYGGFVAAFGLFMFGAGLGDLVEQLRRPPDTDA